MSFKTLALTAAIALLAGTLAPATADARGRGGHPGWNGHGHGHRHHWGPGLFWGGVGIAIALSAAQAARRDADDRPRIVDDGWRPAPPDPLAGLPPEPIVYPSRGQSPAQTEADHQACNRWATTQPRAMADAQVFHRATLACMEGRGYAVK